MNYSLNSLFTVVGVSKQSNHQYNKRTEDYYRELSDLIIQADALRAIHPGCGVEKMYYTLKPKFIGRDQFISQFMELGYRVKTPKNYIRTTYSGHIYYPNLVEGMVLQNMNQVWQTDITYFSLNGDFYYLVFIIDVYSREIIGYNASLNMRTESNLAALKKAMKNCGNDNLYSLIHHSDRGSQYTSKKYIDLLKNNEMSVSMGLKGQDNAYAERVNGIIKNEYLNLWSIKDFSDLKRKLRKAVDHYNNKRIHRSLPNRQTPKQFKEYVLNLKREDRPKMNIFAEGKNIKHRPKFYTTIDCVENTLHANCTIL